MHSARSRIVCRVVTRAPYAPSLAPAARPRCARSRRDRSPSCRPVERRAARAGGPRYDRNGNPRGGRGPLRVRAGTQGPVVRLNEGLQILVLDHAGKDVWVDIDVYLVEEWRDGKALVPRAWMAGQVSV